MPDILRNYKAARARAAELAAEVAKLHDSEDHARADDLRNYGLADARDDELAAATTLINNLVGAVERMADVLGAEWAEDAGMSCREANAIARCMTLAGRHHNAAVLLVGHAVNDIDETDLHAELDGENYAAADAYVATLPTLNEDED